MIRFIRQFLEARRKAAKRKVECACQLSPVDWDPVYKVKMCLMCGGFVR